MNYLLKNIFDCQKSECCSIKTKTHFASENVKIKNATLSWQSKIIHIIQHVQYMNNVQIITVKPISTGFKPY